MKLHRKPIIHGQPRLEFRRIMLLSIFCAVGILAGCISVQYVSEHAVSQLTSYLDSYILFRQTKTDLSSFAFSFVVYFRYLLLLFLFSFSPVGIYFVPLFCAIQGFGLSFAIMLFAQCIEGSFWIIAALFGLRCLFLLPTMFYAGSIAIVSANCGRESHGKDFWKRFGVCACVLLFGAILETLVVPNIFAAVYAV